MKHSGRLATLIVGGALVVSFAIALPKLQSHPVPQIPLGASAQCRDGSYSYSMNHRGTCSHHGGVARWYR